MMLRRTLVIGFGSIGERHARILCALGCSVSVLSRREIDFPVVFHSIEEALLVAHPDYIVIANETNLHYETLLKLAEIGFKGTVLVEKPLFSNWVKFDSTPFLNVFVGYNLRFNPVIQRLRALLEGDEILSVQAYVGQYLPSWRPSSDYRSSYSAKQEQGGGVLRDLSHEMDYLLWMLGKWQCVSALGGHLSSLEITSDDVFSLMMVTSKCPIVNIQLNYLDRLTRRTILINTNKHTIEADLINGVLTIDQDREVISVERDDSYIAMHDAIISNEMDSICTLEDGEEVLRLIKAAEAAAKYQKWVDG